MMTQTAENKVNSGLWKKAVLFIAVFLFPLICGLFSLWFSGIRWFNHVNLLGNIGIDEVVYHKMVGAVANGDGILGYFGTNESRAVVGRNFAWSPVLYLIWMAFGKVFGWGYYSPMICNFLLLGIALVIFVLVTKPNRNQLIRMAIVYFSCSYITQYAFATMPEINVLAPVIVFAAFCISYVQGLSKNATFDLGMMYAIATVLVLMRPYFFVFLLIPIALCVTNSKKKSMTVLWNIVFAALVLVGYFLISKYCSAPYYKGLWKTEWITLLKKSPVNGVVNIFTLIFSTVKEFLGNSARAFAGNGAIEEAEFTLVAAYVGYKFFTGKQKITKIFWGGWASPALQCYWL